ncbi:MAG: hypothetical protein GTN70_05245 [Deltaproteobacteria bacterium]|nr:hypothetical protein [Deltaproteobacteria bacterium]NIS77083.1 hypothetical protein [Deltaproteobacteria bacterium]
MRKLTTMMFVFLLGVCLATSVFGESATKEECEAKVKEAVQMFSDQGADAAIDEVNKTDGKFVWKDSYVFVLDLEGNYLANGTNPKVVGTNILNWKDTNGKLVTQALIDVAKTKGEGWLDYMYPKPSEIKKPIEERIPSKKMSYVMRVPGKDILVGAGIYEQ